VPSVDWYPCPHRASHKQRGPRHRVRGAAYTCKAPTTASTNAHKWLSAVVRISSSRLEGTGRTLCECILSLDKQCGGSILLSVNLLGDGIRGGRRRLKSTQFDSENSFTSTGSGSYGPHRGPHPIQGGRRRRGRQRHSSMFLHAACHVRFCAKSHGLVPALSCGKFDGFSPARKVWTAWRRTPRFWASLRRHQCTSLRRSPIERLAGEDGVRMCTNLTCRVNSTNVGCFDGIYRILWRYDRYAFSNVERGTHAVPKDHVARVVSGRRCSVSSR
jgi:hypothetical protein